MRNGKYAHCGDLNRALNAPRRGEALHRRRQRCKASQQIASGPRISCIGGDTSTVSTKVRQLIRFLRGWKGQPGGSITGPSDLFTVLAAACRHCCTTATERCSTAACSCSAAIGNSYAAGASPPFLNTAYCRMKGSALDCYATLWSLELRRLIEHHDCPNRSLAIFVLTTRG